MRIIHVSTATSWRGGEQQIVYLIEAIRSHQIEQAILCPKGSPLAQHCCNNDFKVINYNKHDSLGINGAKKLTAACANASDVIIHAHDSHAHTLVFFAAVLFRLSAPIVVHRRVDFPAGKSWFSKIKYNHESIKKFICISKVIRDVLVSSLRRPEKAVVIYSGISPDRFEHLPVSNILRREFDIPPDKILVGNVSALADHKDYPSFIRTASKLCSEDDRFRFVIVGEGSLYDELESLVQELKLTDKVFFAGFRRDVPLLLKELDIFFIPSKMEGLGTSILDAFASRVPVVTTNTGGIPELVVHEETGLLSRVGDIEQMASHIRRVTDDFTLRQRLIHQALKKVAQFDYRETARLTLEVYRQLLQ